MINVNFALIKKDNHVAPYLALTELVNANVKWLDTINKSLYGKKLDKFVSDIKKAEIKK